LADFSYQNREKKPQETKIVVSISNWHFVRDNEKKKNCSPCRPEDCTVTFKLSSTVFKPAGGVETVQNPNDKDLFFDKVGAIIPYSAFSSLMSAKGFVDTFCSTVKKEYERVCGPIPEIHESNDDDDEEEEGGNNDNGGDDDDDEEGENQADHHENEELESAMRQIHHNDGVKESESESESEKEETKKGKRKLSVKKSSERKKLKQ
jgi:hypothetical protein